MICRGVRSSHTISTMRRPDCRASSNIFGLLASTGAAPGKRHPERLADDVHRVGGAHAGAHAGAGDGVVAHAGERFLRELAEHRLHRADEHLLDVDVLALVVPARLIAADDEDGRDVEATGRHQVRRRRLVARRQADHAVELCALDGNLHVVDDEVAARQHVAAALGRR